MNSSKYNLDQAGNEWEFLKTVRGRVRSSHQKCSVKNCSEQFRKFHRKTAVLEFLFNKVTTLEACNIIKMSLQRRYFPVKFEKILRTATLKNICERLLLESQFLVKHAKT